MAARAPAGPKAAAVHYHVRCADLRAHLYDITLEIESPQALQRLSLPVWIPGSYLVREFARHLFDLRARQGRRVVEAEPVDKATWKLRCSGSAPLVLRYRVHAFDTSVRAAYLDTRRGFFNATSLVLRAHGREALPHRVTLAGLPAGWQVATAMDPADQMIGQRAELVASRDVGDDEMAAYERVLTEALEGDAALFARMDYVEEAWRIVDPLRTITAPVREYEPGTWGPAHQAADIIPPGGWADSETEGAVAARG